MHLLSLRSAQKTPAKVGKAHCRTLQTMPVNDAGALAVVILGGLSTFVSYGMAFKDMDAGYLSANNPYWLGYSKTTIATLVALQAHHYVSGAVEGVGAVGLLVLLEHGQWRDENTKRYVAKTTVQHTTWT